MELEYKSVNGFLAFRFKSEISNDIVYCHSILSIDELISIAFNDERILIETKSSLYDLSPKTFFCKKVCKQTKEYRYLRPNEHFIFTHSLKSKILELQQTETKKVRKIKEPKAEHIKRIYSIFGEDIALIHIKTNDKMPIKKGWVFFTWDQTQEKKYQKFLAKTNIGIHCGDQSNGLCSIDLDNEESQKIFLDLNPALKDTVKTMGSRGCNFWVKIKGTCPIVRHFKFGSLKGEFRGSGGQTVIYGGHPSGCNYKIIEGKIPTLAFNDLVFPTDAALNIDYHMPYYFNDAKFSEVFEDNIGYISRLKYRGKIHSKKAWRINNKTIIKVNKDLGYQDIYERFYKKRVEYGS